MYLDANNLYRWEISQKLLLNGFKWKKNIYEFNEEFIENYKEHSHEWYIFLK